MSHDWIAVRGARVHNLRNIDVDLPRDRLAVITGLSGSGKSSLAFDTIYAEGQRRYVESLSAYARQFLEQMEKPDVDLIDGLSPAISIEQKTTAANPRSTVGTVTEVYDYLRLLFANIGVPHCPNCDREISSQSLERILDLVMASPPDERINVLAPIVRGRKGEFKKDLAALRQRGFTRARIDGQFVALDNEITLDRRRNHSIDVLVDRLIVKPGIERRLTDGIDLALKLAGDVVVINTLAGGDRLFSRRLACPDCGISVPEMAPRVFSFNSPHGACQECQGLGAVHDFDPARIVPDDSQSLAAGAVLPGQGDRRLVVEMLEGLQRTFGIDPALPFGKLPRRLRDIVLYGAGGRKSRASDRDTPDDPDAKARKSKRASNDPFGADFEGAVPNLRRRYEEGTWTEQEVLEPLRALQPCPACRGDRLRPESLAVRVKGRRVSEFVNLPVSDAPPGVRTAGAHRARAADRRACAPARSGTGSGSSKTSVSGISRWREARRRSPAEKGNESVWPRRSGRSSPACSTCSTSRRSVCISATTGSCWRRLCKLRNLGNTVVVVEHDEETIRTADYLVDLGLGAGEHGGEVIFQGLPQQLLRRSGPIAHRPVPHRRAQHSRAAGTTTRGSRGDRRPRRTSEQPQAD